MLEASGEVRPQAARRIRSNLPCDRRESTGRISTVNDLLLIDCLQASRPSRERFLEWREGGVGCVHVTLAIWENARETLTAIGTWNRMFADHADLIALAGSAGDIEAIRASGRTAVVMGFQNASPLEDDIDLVRIFHALGVRIVQLTYNIQNHVGSGCWEDEDRGISQFWGRNLIREMNQAGMLIDLSHCGERTCFDAVELSERPVAITHANPSGWVGFDIELKRRNKSDDLIRAVAESGGVIGLGMYPKIMRGGAAATLDDFCEMVEWTAERFGVDAVGFGTDFHAGHSPDAIIWWRAGRWARSSPVQGTLARWPDWFDSPAQFPGVLEGLRRRGFSGEDLRRIAGGNWLRLFRESFGPMPA